jgi:hypothetical protein
MILEEYVLNYLLLYVLFEAYEIWWQKAETLLGILAKMYHQYKRNVWLFFLMQPTFYFSMIFMMLCDYNLYSVILFSLKGSDIVTKVILMKQVYIDKKVSQDVSELLVAHLPQFVLYIGLVLYPVLIIMALE